MCIRSSVSHFSAAGTEDMNRVPNQCGFLFHFLRILLTQVLVNLNGKPLYLDNICQATKACVK